MSKSLKIVAATALLFAAPTFAANNTIQDTKRAAQYFEEEMNFKTNPYAVKYVLDNKITGVAIIDVRAKNDFANGHIPGAINLPFDQYSSFEGNETKFPGLIKNGYNYVYCYKLLCNLAQKAAKKFATLGYPVKEMVGGFNSWQEDGYPVES